MPAPPKPPKPPKPPRKEPMSNRNRNRTRTRTRTRKSAGKPTGNCYDTALKYAAWEVPADERGRYRVVHGYPIGQGPIEGVKHGHAWVERTDPVPPDLPEAFARNADDFFTTVIDKSNGKDVEWPRSLYYGLGNIDRAECVYYSVEEAMALAVRHGHWGPWTPAPQGAR